MVLKNIKEYVKNRKEELKNIVENLKHEPTLVIVQVGDNEASNRYVRNKVRDCEEVGIEAQVYYFPEDIGEEELKHEIECL
jgi:methylenetetrahydrofolate dehydrogenase (NADP+)/methenyltetrahydrofolate cyclohydrolase